MSASMSQKRSVVPFDRLRLKNLFSLVFCEDLPNFVFLDISYFYEKVAQLWSFLIILSIIQKDHNRVLLDNT
jgi:hypothetical protein